MSVAAGSVPNHPSARAASRLFATLVVLSGLLALVFWASAAVPYFGLNRETFGPFPDLYWPRRYPLLLHIVGGSVALLLGPVLLWLGETRQRLGLHRSLGFGYLTGVVVGAGAAFYLALTTPVGWVFASGLFGLAVAWTLTTGMAFLAIKRRAITQHREWMVRSYVVTLGFVFFRMLVVGLDALEVGTTVERVGVAAWFCWAVPLLIAEPVLQWRKQARP